MSILKIKDANNNFISIPSIKGETGPIGPQGPSYDDTALSGRVTAIENKIPSEASSSNKLADKNYVDTIVGNIESLLGDI